MKAFNVTYDIVTPESTELGDTDETGFIAEQVDLRTAVNELFQCRTSACDSGNGLEDSGRWFSYYHGMEFETGAYETRALHPPRSCTGASYARLARLLNSHR